MATHVTQLTDLHSVLIATLTIASGATISEVLSADAMSNFRQLEIHASAATHTGTVTVQKQSRVGVNTFLTLQSPPGTDVVLTANKVTPLTQNGSAGLRLLSSAPEGSDRVFYVWGVRGQSNG